MAAADGFDARELALVSRWECNWRETGTPHGYAEAVLARLDAAKDRFFSLEGNPYSFGSSVGNLWVVRNHVVHLLEPFTFHRDRDHKTVMTVKTRLVRVGTTSVGVEQTITCEGDRLLVLCTSTIVTVDEDGAPRKLVFAGESVPPVDHTPEWEELAASAPDLHSREWPGGEERRAARVEMQLVPRPSDLDALGHVNNCNLALFVYDARCALEDSVAARGERAFHYDYVRPLFAKERYRVAVFPWRGLEVVQIETEAGDLCFRAKSKL